MKLGGFQVVFRAKSFNKIHRSEKSSFFILKANMVLCFQCKDHSYPDQQHLGISTFFLCKNKINLGYGSVSSSKTSDSLPKWRPCHVQNWLQFPTGIICSLCAELESVCSWMDLCLFHVNGRVRKEILVNKCILHIFPLWCAIIHQYTLAANERYKPVLRL